MVPAGYLKPPRAQAVAAAAARNMTSVAKGPGHWYKSRSEYVVTAPAMRAKQAVSRGEV